jgi:hypothetical protein
VVDGGDSQERQVTHLSPSGPGAFGWLSFVTLTTTVKGGKVALMSKCPRCEGGVCTPFFLDQQGWSALTCPHCAARLRIKGLRSAAFAPLMVSLSVFGHQGHVFTILAEILMAIIVILFILECMHPQLGLRKGPPLPEIKLNLNGPKI